MLTHKYQWLWEQVHHNCSMKIQFLDLNAGYICAQFKYISIAHTTVFVWFCTCDSNENMQAWEVESSPWRESLTGDPDVVQLRWLLYNFSGECVQGELQLLPVQWILHTHLLRSEKTVCHNKSTDRALFGGLLKDHAITFSLIEMPFCKVSYISMTILHLSW